VKLPSLRALAGQLRELHVAWAHPEAGGEFACLAEEDDGWRACAVGSGSGREIGREWVPGDGARFDAPAAARGLLAAAEPQREG
jgi:hypothetical protein